MGKFAAWSRSSPDDAAAKKQAARWIKDLLQHKVACVIERAGQLTPRRVMALPA